MMNIVKKQIAAALLLSVNACIVHAAAGGLALVQKAQELYDGSQFDEALKIYSDVATQAGMDQDARVDAYIKLGHARRNGLGEVWVQNLALAKVHYQRALDLMSKADERRGLIEFFKDKCAAWPTPFNVVALSDDESTDDESSDEKADTDKACSSFVIRLPKPLVKEAINVASSSSSSDSLGSDLQDDEDMPVVVSTSKGRCGRRSLATTPLVYCDACRESYASIAVHLRTDKHKQNERALRVENVLSSNDDDYIMPDLAVDEEQPHYWCELCQRGFKSPAIYKEHEGLSTHLQHLKKPAVQRLPEKRW